MKKFASLLLALIMAMSLAVPAFADDPTPDASGNALTTYQAESKGFEMKVTLSGNTNIKVVFNPYGIKVTDNVLKVEDSTDQIISAPVFITSKTEVPIIIDAKFVAYPTKADANATPPVEASGITAIKTTPIVPDATDNAKNTKDVFVYFEIAQAGDASDAPNWKKLDDATKALFTAYETARADLAAAPTDAAKKTARDTAAKALTDVGLCPPQTTIANNKTIETDTNLYKFEKLCVMAAGNEEPTYAAFHVAGNALPSPYVNKGTSASPKWEPGNWDAKDTFEAQVLLSFRPDVSNS